MAVLTDEMVTDLALELKALNITKKTTTVVVHMLHTKQQAQEMLDYLKKEQPTDTQEIFKKMEEILG